MWMIKKLRRLKKESFRNWISHREHRGHGEVSIPFFSVFSVNSVAKRVLFCFFAAALRQRISWPGGTMRPRPVHLNSWEACYFDHDAKRILGLAQAAADLGSVLAGIRYCRHIGLYSDATARALRRAFLTGYSALRPLPSEAALGWYTAAALLAERALRAAFASATSRSANTR